MQPIRRAGALVSRQVSGSSSARSFSTEGGRLLNPNPRPTQYQTVIVNEAVNPAPGKPFSFTPYIVGLGVFMFVFPCMQTTMELRKYYKEVKTRELVTTGLLSLRCCLVAKHNLLLQHEGCSSSF